MQPANPSPNPDEERYDDAMLDGLEASIEQRTQIGPHEAGPPNNMLDAVEHFTEQARPRPPDPPAEMIPDLLWKLERQMIPPEIAGFEPAPDPVPEAFGSFESEPPLPGEEEHSTREYPPPPGLSKGRQGTGSNCLGSGGTSMGWCELHDKLVSSLDCEECDDYSGDSECEHWSDA